MSVEHWERHIKAKPGRFLTDPSFFMSSPEEIAGTGGVTVTYLVVGEAERLATGVYAQTNVPPESYRADRRLREAIRTYVQADLAVKRTPEDSPESPEGVLVPDFSNAIFFTQYGLAPNGGLVLRMDPADPAKARRFIRDVESGENRARTIPVNPQKII